MKDEIQEVLQRAIQVGSRSPCRKSQRGVVLWRPSEGVLGEGFNHLPGRFLCDGSKACRSGCSKLCVHAEMAALFDALKQGHSVKGAEMLHVKVVNGVPVSSGPPSCWQCSRHLLEARIEGMWLLHEDGLCRSRVEEFHRMTLQHCGLK